MLTPSVTKKCRLALTTNKLGHCPIFLLTEIGGLPNINTSKATHLPRRVPGADGRKPLPSGRFSSSGGQLLAGLGVRFR